MTTATVKAAKHWTCCVCGARIWAGKKHHLDRASGRRKHINCGAGAERDMRDKRDKCNAMSRLSRPEHPVTSVTCVTASLEKLSRHVTLVTLSGSDGAGEVTMQQLFAEEGLALQNFCSLDDTRPLETDFGDDE